MLQCSETGELFCLTPLTFFQDYEYPNHPQSTQHQKNDRCPPPPQMLPERACEVPGCRSDSECERHKRCCYNGCIYACLESVQPPPGQQWRRAFRGCRNVTSEARSLSLEMVLLHSSSVFLLHAITNVFLTPSSTLTRFNPARLFLFFFNAVLDWLVQPKPRWLGGNGWLLDGPEEVLQGGYRLT